jgi:hypothetical protein
VWHNVRVESSNPQRRSKELKQPTVATMYRWMDTGIAKATDGCKTDLDGHCKHDKASWLLVLGVV